MIHTITRRGIARLAGVGTLGVLAGCAQLNGDEDGETDAQSGDGGTVMAVADREVGEDDEFYFEPQMATVEPGATVQWEVESGRHTVTAFHPNNQVPNRIPENADPFDSDTLAEDDTFDVQFDEEGVYDYFCQPHEHEGMVGTVVVGDPDPAGQPGLEEPRRNEDIDEPAIEELIDLNERTVSSLEER